MTLPSFLIILLVADDGECKKEKPTYSVIFPPEDMFTVLNKRKRLKSLRHVSSHNINLHRTFCPGFLKSVVQVTIQQNYKHTFDRSLAITKAFGTRLAGQLYF